MDLILYLLRLTASRIPSIQQTIPPFFPGEVFSALTSPSFKLILFSDTNASLDLVGRSIIETLKQLAKVHNFHNFELISQVASGKSWDQNTFKATIPSTAHRIYISAPVLESDYFYTELLAAHFAPDILTKL